VADHRQEIKDKLFLACDWSWTGHGDAPADASSLKSKLEGHPIDWLDKQTRYPALFFTYDQWPMSSPLPNMTTELFRFTTYVVLTKPTNAYLYDAAMALMRAVTTNLLAAKEINVPAYNLTNKLDLDYVVDIRLVASSLENPVASFLRAYSLPYICDMSSFEIMADGER